MTYIRSSLLEGKQKVWIESIIMGIKILYQARRRSSGRGKLQVSPCFRRSNFGTKIKYDLSRLTALDVSADLHELTRCPVSLVSSGVKSILDIKRFVLSVSAPLPSLPTLAAT